MTEPAASGAGGVAPRASSLDHRTYVELTHIEKRIENWLPFGPWVHEHFVDRHRRIVSFGAGDIFAFVRWASNDFGTIVSRIDVIRAVAPGEAYQTVPFVRPGGEILLRVTGWHQVQKVLHHIDAVEAMGIAPAAVSSDHWRHVANRMTAGLPPRAYTADHHQAWLKRREYGP